MNIIPKQCSINEYTYPSFYIRIYTLKKVNVEIYIR